MKANVIYPPDSPAQPERIMEAEAEAQDLHVACEELWRRFNHAHPGITGMDAEKHKCRSMSVGDMVEFENGRIFVAAPVGFEEIDAERRNEILRIKSIGDRAMYMMMAGR